MNPELKQLIELQQIDTEIKKLETELTRNPTRRVAIEREFDERAVSFKTLETQAETARLTRTQRETELAHTREALSRAERNLMKSQTGDEYSAAIREADAARKTIATLETQILESMDATEKAEAELTAHATEIAGLRGELEASLQTFDREAEHHTHTLAQARARREQIIAAMSKQTLAIYTRIASRIRDGRALAEARNGTCTACSIRVRPQMMVEIKRSDDIIQCDNCGRILYFVPVEQPQSAPATGVK